MHTVHPITNPNPISLLFLLYLCTYLDACPLHASLSDNCRRVLDHRVPAAEPYVDSELAFRNDPLPRDDIPVAQITAHQLE